MLCFRVSVWPPPYHLAFDHLKPKDDFFVDNEDAYYTTDLESEDGEKYRSCWWHCAIKQATPNANVRPMSHLQFYRAILSRNFIARQNRKCDMPCRTLQLCRINKNWPISVHRIFATKLHRIERWSNRKKSCATRLRFRCWKNISVRRRLADNTKLRCVIISTLAFHEYECICMLVQCWLWWQTSTCICRSSFLLSDRNIRCPHRMLPPGESRWGWWPRDKKDRTDRQWAGRTDAMTLHADATDRPTPADIPRCASVTEWFFLQSLVHNNDCMTFNYAISYIYLHTQFILFFPLWLWLS